MAALGILTGYAGKYVSESFSSTANGADTLDLSHCGQVMLQSIIDTPTPTGTAQLEQTIDGTHWSNVGGPLDVSINGNIGSFGATDGPFGLCRLAVSVSGGAVHLELVGFPNSIRE